MAKVSLVRCTDYDRLRVAEAVKRAVDLVGGMGKFVAPGMRVLIKPNLLSPRPPEDAVVTHPEVVRAVVRLVKACGATPLVGDSPGGFGSNIDEIYETSGMRRMAGEEKVELVTFTNARFVDGMPITRYVFECDRFISVPKLKTHCVTVMTCAVKNVFGTVVGLYKAGCHSVAPRGADLAKVMARVYAAARPHLSIVDGIEAMEGDGPSQGKVRKLGCVMAGEDAVAIDTVAARIIGAPREIAVTREAAAMGLGEGNMARIEVAGDAIEGIAVTDFAMPQTMPFEVIPKGLAGFLGKWITFKPYIDRKRCKRCNLCKVTCPVHAITIEEASCGIEYATCVRCMCCHEVCPYHAIGIKRNLLTRMIWG